MIKKIILLLILLCMIAVPTFAVGGTYTTNNYFYMPAYGAYGAAEFAEYNAYMEIADNQIEANKVLGEAAVDTSGVPVANDIPRFTDLNTIEGLSYAEFKAALDLEIGTDILAQQSIGISNDYLLEVDGTPNSAEYARFTVNGLEGRTEAEFKGDFNLEIGTDVQAHNTALDNFVTWADGGWNTGRVVTYNGATGMPSYPDIQVFSSVDDMFVMHECGGLEADVSAYSGLVAISGGSTAEVDALAELEAQIGDVTHFVVEGVACSNLEGTLLAIAGGTLNAAIPEDHVNATMLKDDNAPADEDLFSYELTGTTGHWYSRDEVGIKFSKFDANAAPTVNNDVDEGYVVGSNWYDVTADNAYGCLDNTDGAAVWSQFIPTGGGGGWVDISGAPVDNDIAMFTDADTIEGRSYLEHRNDCDQYIVYPQPYATGAGTVGDPWAGDCLNDAYTACPTGGTIYMRAGYYSLTTNLIIGKKLNLIGEGIDRTIIVTGDNRGISISSAGDYTTLKGFTIDADAQTGHTTLDNAINLDNCDYVILENIEAKEAGYYGINLFEVNHCICKNLYSHDNYRHGFHPGNNATGRNKWNSYRDLYAWNNGVSGFSDRGSNSTTGNIEATFNVYDNIQCWDNSGTTNTLNAFIVACQKNVVISNCLVDSNYGRGMYLSYLEDSSIVNCTITNNGAYGMFNIDSKNLNFTNVIIKNNNYLLIGATTGIRMEGGSNFRFNNCQITDSRTVTGVDIAFVDGGGGEDTITMTSARFLGAGFVAGQNITVTGAGQAGNNDTFAIVSVVAGTINVATASLTTEAAGASVTITQAKMQSHVLRTIGTADKIEFVNCDLRGNLTDRFYNDASSTITGTDAHELIEDHDFSGKWETAKVGESVVFGELLYFNWTDKEWKKTDADAAATMPGLRIALESKADGATCLMLIEGEIRDDSAYAFAGSMVYASCTPGDITSTAPSASGDQVQRVGVATHADYFYFDPSPDQGEI